MRVKVITLFFAAVTCIYTTSAQKSITVASGGKSQYSIVIPPAANDLEKRGAELLQEYLIKVANCKLPITSKEGDSKSYQIVIGRTNKVSNAEFQDLGEDGTLIKCVDNTLILTGGNRLGVLYSVCTFIEDFLGCQVFTVDAIEVPKKSTVSFPGTLYKKHKPSFLYRTTYFPESLSHLYCGWRKLNYFKEFFGLWAHSFNVLLPPEQHFAAHPEYFALVNGVRNPAQLDVTNPDVLQIVVKNLRTLIAANPTARYWSVSQNDTPTNQEYCECERCKKLNKEQDSPNGALLTFVNAVAKNFPDKIITTLAYGFSEKPPKTLKPDKNVMVMYCATSQNVLTPLASHPSASFNQRLKKWSEITNNLFLWDYVVQFEHTLLPLPNIKSLQSNIQYFKKNNVKFLFEQGSGDVMGEFSELRCYLVSKLMWDVNMDFDSSVNRFLNGYYGKTGGPYMRQYLDVLHKNASINNPPMYTYGNINAGLKSYLSNNNTNTYKNIFKKALNAVDSNSVYGKRIMKEYTSVLYAEIENNKYQFSQQKQLDRRNKTSYIKSLDYWYQKAKAANIKFLNEGRRDVNNYYKSYSDQLNNYPSN